MGVEDISGGEERWEEGLKGVMTELEYHKRKGNCKSD